MQNYLPLLIVPGFLAFFAGFWCLVGVGLAQMSGWATLARLYKAMGHAPGPRSPMQSGALNGVAFGSALTVGVSEQGLFLAVFPLFRAGHPPLLIPWSQMSDFELEKRLWATVHTTRIRAGSETVELTLNDRRVADRIQLYISQSTSGSISDGSSKRA